MPSIFKVSISSNPNGTITATPDEGPEGTQIALHVAPNERYKLISLKAGTEDIDISGPQPYFFTLRRNVTVVAEFEALPADMFSVTIPQNPHGRITADPEYGPADTEIRLTVQVNPGYKLSRLLVDNEAIDITGSQPYAFTLTKDVTVTAEFEPLPANTFSVTVTPSANGTVTADPKNGTAGTSISLHAQANEGYRLKSLKFDNTSIDITGSSPYIFILPAKHVTVTSEFELLPPNLFSVTIEPVVRGTVTADPAFGTAGTQIRLFVQADPGFRLVSLSVDGSPMDISGPSPYTFNLTKNVNVTAVFEELPANEFSVTAASIANGRITANPTSGTAGTEITLDIIPDVGYKLQENSLRYTTNGALQSEPICEEILKFTMPAFNVTVTAVFELIAQGDVEELLSAGISALEAGRFTNAINYFENAYAQAPANQKAIVYSTLGRLASIAASPDVRDLMTDLLGVKNYPGTIDGLINPEWLETYTEEELVWWYNDGEGWVSWWDARWNDWEFNHFGLERKSGYYRRQELNPRLMIPGETERRPGTSFLQSYHDENKRWIFWTADGAWVDGYYDGISGYYHRDSYIFVTSIPRGEQSYYDENLGEWVHWLENYNQFAVDGQGYYYLHSDGYELISEDRIYWTSYYYDNTGRWYYWDDLDPNQRWGDDVYGWNGPGYYWTQDQTFVLVSETPIYEEWKGLLPGLNVADWFKDTDLYKDSYTTKSLQSSFTFTLRLLTNVIDRNPDGLNVLLDGILSGVFGNDFETAYTRAKTLTGDIKLEDSTLEAFGLAEIFEGEAIYIGDAELNLLFGALRFIKASLEWAAAYDWNTDLSFLKNTELWDDFTKLGTVNPRNLPLRNNFLGVRQGMMEKSKANFILAIDDSIAAYNSYIGAGSRLPEGYKNFLKDYEWVKDGFDKLKIAISTGGNFFVKMHNEGASTYINNSTNAFVGINMGKFFNPGQFSLANIIETKNVPGKGLAPKFYGFPDRWGNDETSPPATGINNHSIAANDEVVEITSRDQITDFGWVGFMLKTTPITEVIFHGIDDIPQNIELDFMPSDFAVFIWDWYHN